MALQSGFFNSIDDDRAKNAEFFGKYFASFIGNGVFANPATNFQVVSNNSMDIIVTKGSGWINGTFCYDKFDYIITLDVADGVLNRIDRVVLRLDTIDREIKILVKKGEYGTNAVAPELQRDADAYELALADIAVNRGIISITQANITDLRLNKELCGIVHGVVDQVDTTAIFNQFESWYAQTKANYDADIATWTQEKKDAFDTWYTTNINEFESRFNNWFSENTTTWDNEFTTWFDNIKGQLEGDIAANLTAEILELQNTKAGKTELAEVGEDLSSHLKDNATIKHKAKEVGLEDMNNNFISKNIEGAMNELFLNASNGKTDIASVVGSPANANNTFAQLKTHIQNAKNKGATNLTAKGTAASGTETLDSIMSKIGNVNTGKRWASGSVSASSTRYLTVRGLKFRPSHIIVRASVAGLQATYSILESLTSNKVFAPPFYNNPAAEASWSIYNDGFYLSSPSDKLNTTSPYNWIAFE